jgi:hypothetical protein
MGYFNYWEFSTFEKEVLNCNFHGVLRKRFKRRVLPRFLNRTDKKLCAFLLQFPFKIYLDHMEDLTQLTVRIDFNLPP